VVHLNLTDASLVQRMLALWHIHLFLLTAQRRAEITLAGIVHEYGDRRQLGVAVSQLQGRGDIAA
jgi:hypothetical protein